MGRIVATVDVTNSAHPENSLKCDALVDTGASYLTLPLTWKDRLGEFEAEAQVELETATQTTVRGTVCGPVRIKVEGFRAIFNEALFLDMDPEDGEYEPLLGYIVLEQCGAAVDRIGHRLIPVKHMDLKSLRDIPPTLDSELRRRAREEGKSLNRVAIEALIRSAGLSESPIRQRDLSDIAATWQEDPEFDRAIADQDRLDEHLWR